MSNLTTVGKSEIKMDARAKVTGRTVIQVVLSGTVTPASSAGGSAPPLRRLSAANRCRATAAKLPFGYCAR